MEKKEKCKFYADLPDGKKNVYMVWNVANFDETINLIGNSLQKGYVFRAVFHVYEDGRSMRIPQVIIESAGKLKAEEVRNFVLAWEKHKTK